MKARNLVSVLAGLCATFLSAACSVSPLSSLAARHQEPLSILATSATRMLDTHWAEGFSTDIEVHHSNSIDLGHQLVLEAPGDVLITSDYDSMQYALDKGVVENPVAVARNSMVVAIPGDNPAGISAFTDLANVTLAMCEDRRPCGDIPRKLLAVNNMQLTPDIQEGTVDAVLEDVISGQATAGFVYRTDAMLASNKIQVITVPRSEENLNTLYAARVTKSRYPELADQFISMLTSAEQQTIWQQYGFLPPA